MQIRELKIPDRYEILPSQDARAYHDTLLRKGN
ncbi:hypothetical protein ABIE24_002334 [Mycetocola sp. 2940]